MTYIKTVLVGIALTLIASFSNAQEPPSPVATGTLIVDILPYRSEGKLPKKADKQLKSGGIEWGMRGDQLVFSMVNRRFIDFPIDKMTRYGTRETLTLPAGRYRITGIGLEFSAGFDVQKILDRGAFVNEDVVVFEISPGGTTTLSVDPLIKKDAAFAVNFWVPDMLTSVSTDGAQASAPVALNLRGETSIAWPAYNGPLKFKAQ